MSFIITLLQVQIDIIPCYRLKRGYTSYRSEMSETGQGLMDEDREDEIVEGSEIDNIHSGLYLCPPN